MLTGIKSHVISLAMEDTKQIVVRMPLALIEAITEQAAKEDRTVANMVRVLCQRALSTSADA